MRTELLAKGICKIWRDGSREVVVAIERLMLISGEVKALVGPSGSGKSTAMDMLALALKPDMAEQLTLSSNGHSRELTQLLLSGPESRRARIRASHFSYVVQNGALLPFLTVEGNVALQQKISGRGDRELGRRTARILGIEEQYHAYPASLSVGQRQRAAVARALACNPKILLADEPTAALDPDSARQVMRACVDAAQAGAAVLLVTHDHALIEEFNIPAVPLHTASSEGRWFSSFRDGTTTLETTAP